MLSIFWSLNYSIYFINARLFGIFKNNFRLYYNVTNPQRFPFIRIFLNILCMFQRELQNL